MARSRSLKTFIKENREEIDRCILRVCPNITLNDSDRAQWINNDEGLYLWAKSWGWRG